LAIWASKINGCRFKSTHESFSADGHAYLVNACQWFGSTDSYGGRKTTQKSRIDSNSILRGLIIYDLSRMGKKQQQYNEYKRMSRKLEGDRKSPGGSNRQHNNSLQQQ
ncbi:hypothetical protein GBA52_012978, partial [Prunus armeniaca]